MRRYETVFIVNSELSEEQHQPLFDKLEGLVSDDQGVLVKFDKWGHKKLAYEIKKQTRGYYVLMDFCGHGALVKEVERSMRLDDRVLKYMTVVKDKTVDVEAVKADIEAAKEQASKPEPAENATDEGKEKGGPESTETEQPPLSESEVIEQAPESSSQEEQENDTK